MFPEFAGRRLVVKPKAKAKSTSEIVPGALGVVAGALKPKATSKAKSKAKRTGETDRQADRQTTDRQTGRQTDRQSKFTTT